MRLSQSSFLTASCRVGLATEAEALEYCNRETLAGVPHSVSLCKPFFAYSWCATFDFLCAKPCFAFVRCATFGVLFASFCWDMRVQKLVYRVITIAHSAHSSASQSSRSCLSPSSLVYLPLCAWGCGSGAGCNWSDTDCASKQGDVKQIGVSKPWQASYHFSVPLPNAFMRNERRMFYGDLGFVCTSGGKVYGQHKLQGLLKACWRSSWTGGLQVAVSDLNSCIANSHLRECQRDPFSFHCVWCLKCLKTFILLNQRGHMFSYCAVPQGSSWALERAQECLRRRQETQYTALRMLRINDV